MNIEYPSEMLSDGYLILNIKYQTSNILPTLPTLPITLNESWLFKLDPGITALIDESLLFKANPPQSVLPAPYPFYYYHFSNQSFKI